MAVAAPSEIRSTTGRTSVFRSQVSRVLDDLRHGRIILEENGTTTVFGTLGSDGLEAVIRVVDPKMYQRVAFEGSLGAAEAYLQGEWECDDLVELFRILCRNRERLMVMDSGVSRFFLGLAAFAHRLRKNSRAGSQKNIAAHYDLSNAFFELFLDPTMMYSSAYYEDDAMSLDEASLAKLDIVCRKLDLGPEDHVLEIGTGWGGFAEYAVRNVGCRVTTTTVSGQQYDFAKKRIEQAEIADRVTLLKKDYRDLSGSYDKIVSIEMIEAVGHDYLPEYVRKCESLLKPEGWMLVQSILMPDQRYERYRKSVDFIQKYVFPGGHLPSVGAIQHAFDDSSQMRLVEYEEFPESYARTLHEWRQRFKDKLDRVRELGFDERFIRLWEYYLCYCEGAFLEHATTVGHFLWRKVAY
ncbi:SAM-dependent methyltransferase [Rubinisphaera margarita]|uniref:SAM-dependent methyltransferase n=1 Tax=Rubinisphaera margarita TaxID=2909586 RepID=UPI001EE97931|nr:cyclopropane-fatty-acyl-phospholipid synthase family protein [Rubinisphaera margarita]MCG6155204.1 cyclopropane-fatty-acyl-phospholipid synthase family protein [Rubinisphaera margarita]